MAVTPRTGSTTGVARSSFQPVTTPSPAYRVRVDSPGPPVGYQEPRNDARADTQDKYGNSAVVRADDKRREGGGEKADDKKIAAADPDKKKEGTKDAEQKGGKKDADEKGSKKGAGRGSKGGKSRDDAAAREEGGAAGGGDASAGTAQADARAKRLAQAARQLKEPPAVSHPPPLETLMRPMPPPLGASAVISVFASVSFPDLPTESWGKRDSKGNSAALDSAREAFREVSDVARRFHDQMASASGSALQSIGLEYAGAKGRIENLYVSADDLITQGFEFALSTVRDGAGAADRVIVENYLTARDALSSASVKIKKQIDENARTAGEQTDKIIENFAKAFVDPLNDAHKKCKDESDKVTSAYKGFRAAVPQRYPLKGEPDQRVKAEARQTAAISGSDLQLQILPIKTKQTLENFTAHIKLVNADIRGTVQPSLKAHADKIKPEGHAAVKKAFGQAFGTLQKNANEARVATANTHSQTAKQLEELRHAERMRLEQEMNVSVTALHAEADSACATLRASTEATLPRYADAVYRMRGSLSDGAKRGPKSLVAVSATSHDLTGTLANARDAQQTQIETVRAGAVSGFATRETQVRNESAVSTAAANATFDESAGAAAGDMLQVAVSQTQGLSSLAKNITAAGEGWARPLEKAFEGFLKEVQDNLDKGRDAFKQRLDKVRNDFLNWLAPRAKPEVYLEAGMQAAESAAVTKVRDTAQSVASALDAGIFDTVNETALSNALAPLTRVQGEYLRALWPKDWQKPFNAPLQRATYLSAYGENYTLDGHLYVVLGPDSDEYNSAINYLNGNTAEGARYELEASVRWYNDDEDRIKGAMARLTPDQLKDLKNLPAYAGTQKKVQDALDGTDLDVFNALNEGDHFKAEAVLMKEELDSARRSYDKEAANKVLAKYSTATTYGGVAISGEERRAGVQKAFVALTGGDVARKAEELTKQREAEAAKQAATPAIPKAQGAPGAAIPPPAVGSLPAPAAPTTQGAPGAAIPPPAVGSLPAPAGTPPPAIASAPAPTAKSQPPAPAPAPTATPAPSTPQPGSPPAAPGAVQTGVAQPQQAATKSPPATGTSTLAPTGAPAPPPPVNANAPAPGVAPAEPEKKPKTLAELPSMADRWMKDQISEASLIAAPDKPRPKVSDEEAAGALLLDYATRPMTRLRGSHHHYYTETITFEGAEKDLAEAYIFFGEGSPEANAAALGVETSRSGKPDIVKVDKVLVDPRLSPDLPVTDPKQREEIRARALEDRRKMLEIYARKYGGLPKGSEKENATVLINQLEKAFGSDKAGGQLAAMLVKDEYPTPQTASFAMEYAIEGAGTNNELIDATLGRMNRDDIKKMRTTYRTRTKRDLYADLGVFKHGTFGDLSGDDRLKAERMLLGVPRNDKERAEVASFTIQQQREETGIVGGWLASGSLQDEMLKREEENLNTLIGGPLKFGPDGEPQWEDSSRFKDGKFKGDAAQFAASVSASAIAAQNYSNKIDQYANAAAIGIAVIGAIVAAVVTVVTGGAASPLLMAAIAGITGLAAMGAQRLIKGGRYGWEEALTDLGMTAVSALTAGVGQALSLASRGGLAAVQAASKAGMSLNAARQVALKPGLLGNMGRLTGSAYLDKVLIGAGTGGLNAFGQAALQKETWKGGKGATNLWGATVRGIIGGGVTAGVTNAIEDMPLKGLSRFVGGKSNIGEAIGSSTSVLGRGVGKAATSSIGAAAGRASELTYEAARTNRRIDTGDIFVASVEAGAHSLVQSFGEGAAEARAQRIYNARYGHPPPGADVPVTRPPGEHDGARVRSIEEVPGVRPLALEQPETVRAGAHAEPDVEARAARARPAGAGDEELSPTDRKLFEELYPDAAQANKRAAAQPTVESLDAAARRGLPGALDEPVPVRVREREGAYEEPGRVRAPTTEKEGAAAAIPGSRMQLGADEVAATPKVLGEAIDTAVQHASALKGAKVQEEKSGTRLVTLKRADGSPMRVRVEFGDTGSSDVAVFRPGKSREGADWVVTLSKRAAPELHARSVAHELGELRLHKLPEHAADTDLLTTRVPVEGAKLSGHDAGRLNELEVLAGELAAARTKHGPESPEVQRLQGDIDALAAHLGLLHSSEETDSRFLAARSALGHESPAFKELVASRKRAAPDTLDDALHPARAIDDSTRLSARDRRHLAELEELSAKIAAMHGGETERDPRAMKLELDATILLEKLGLLAPDAVSQRRANLATTVFEPGSAAPGLIARLRAHEPQVGGNDALRPGVKPDARTVASPRDVSNAEQLHAALRKLVAAEEVLAGKVGAEKAAMAPEVAQLRRAAEAKAAELGLVFGKGAASRAKFLVENPDIAQRAPFDSELANRLATLRESATTSPLLQPRSGTLNDIELIARQVTAAQEMGDHELVRRLTEIVGFRLEAAGVFSESKSARNKAWREVERLSKGNPAAKALAEDARDRHASRLNAKSLRDDAESMRGSIVRLEEKLAAAEAKAKADALTGKPARKSRADKIRSDIDLLKRSIESIEVAAGEAERVAFRPGGTSADEARAAALHDNNFPTRPRYRTDPDVLGSQQKLVRQIFGDNEDFQSWERFRQMYREINRTVFVEGTVVGQRPKQIEELERIFRRWIEGRRVSEDTPLGAMLTGAPVIRAGKGDPVEFNDPVTKQPVELAPDTPVRSGKTTITATEAVTRRNDLIDDRNLLIARLKVSKDGTEKKTIRKEIDQLIGKINVLSEALGEAAGVAFAKSILGEGATLEVDHGANVPDILHVDTATGRVTLLECKGGDAALGTSSVKRATGRSVRAEQTTPQYLRELGLKLSNPKNSKKVREMGEAILKALDANPPNIDVFVVRQPFDVDNNLGPVEVTKYPVTGSGRT